jgi:hypothetical protein
VSEYTGYDKDLQLCAGKYTAIALKAATKEVSRPCCLNFYSAGNNRTGYKCLRNSIPFRWLLCKLPVYYMSSDQFLKTFFGMNKKEKRMSVTVWTPSVHEQSQLNQRGTIIALT